MNAITLARVVTLLVAAIAIGLVLAMLVIWLAEEARAQTPPAISITTTSYAIYEGDPAVYTITASPAPSADLSVTLTVSQTGSFVATAGTGTKTVTIGTSGRVTYPVPTVDDSNSEDHGTIKVVVATGSGYTVGSPSTALTYVADNDATVAFVANPRASHDGASSLFFVEFEITGTADYYFVNTGSGTEGVSGFDPGDVSVARSGYSNLSILHRSWQVKVLCGRSASLMIRTSSEYTRGSPFFLSLTAAACPVAETTPTPTPVPSPSPSIAYEVDEHDEDNDGDNTDVVNDYGRQGRPSNTSYYNWRCDEWGCGWQPSSNYAYDGPKVCTKNGTAPAAAGRYLTIRAGETTPAGYTCP